MEIIKSIGPTFPAEVEASSVVGLPFSWDSNGVYWTDGALTSDQVTSLEAVVTAHDSTNQPEIPQPFDTTLGWSLGIQPGDQLALDKMAGIIATANNVYSGTDLTAFLATNTVMKDSSGAPHTVTISQAQQLLLGYGIYCQTLWAAGTLPS